MRLGLGLGLDQKFHKLTTYFNPNPSLGYHMNPFGYHMNPFEMDSCGTQWIHMVPKMDSYGTQMDSYGTQMDSYSTQWIHVVPNGFIWYPLGTI